MKSHDDEADPRLSVVIVTHNEEDRVRQCIESVRDACASHSPAEIILVDSNSDDRTVEIATEYPITVLRTPSEVIQTPSAGRFVGTEWATGDFILFVDGDIVLSDSWLQHAIHVIQNGAFAAVDGYLDECDGATRIHPVDAVRGVALYDARILRSVGGFDPFLQSVEDHNLGFRLSAAGYQLARLPRVAGDHPRRNELFEPVRRWRNGYFFGFGQALRSSLDSPAVFLSHVNRMPLQLFMSLWIVCGLVARYYSKRAARAWLTFSAIGVGYTMSVKGIPNGIAWLARRLLGTIGLTIGFLTGTDEPDAYPLEETTVVQLGPEYRESIERPSSSSEFQ